MSLAPAFSVGKTTVFEAVQDIVNTLFDLRNQYVKFRTTEAEREAVKSSVKIVGEKVTIHLDLRT